mmetsp:Transcript_8662/g.36282  ORF Transcript_8662/g.36282 Transcript_8662/m.36282 type:complete len:216 (+) Transcript_8662:1007-1654(+)
MRASVSRAHEALSPFFRPLRKTTTDAAFCDKRGSDAEASSSPSSSPSSASSSSSSSDPAFTSTRKLCEENWRTMRAVPLPIFAFIESRLWSPPATIRFEPGDAWSASISASLPAPLPNPASCTSSCTLSTSNRSFSSNSKSVTLLDDPSFFGFGLLSLLKLSLLNKLTAGTSARSSSRLDTITFEGCTPCSRAAAKTRSRCRSANATTLARSSAS